MIKQHPVFTNYGADENGNVYRNTTPVKPIVSLRGYCVVNLTQCGTRRQYLVHTFVFECFHGIRIWKAANMTIDHINGKKTDNRLSNLRTLSNAENARIGNLGRHGMRCINKGDISVFRDNRNGAIYVTTAYHQYQNTGERAWRQCLSNKSKKSKHIHWLGRLNELGHRTAKGE